MSIRSQAQAAGERNGARREALMAIAKDATLASWASMEWRKIESDILARAETQRPKLRGFEVHHMLEHAREQLFQRIIEESSR